MANRKNKIKPKDVDLEEEEENLQPTPIPVYPKSIYRKRNLGQDRAEKEKRERKTEYGIKRERKNAFEG